MIQHHVYTQYDMEEVDEHPFIDGQVAVYTRRAPDKETTNEDSIAIFQVDQRTGILVVADGMGGAPLGEQASQLALQCIEQALASVTDTQMGLREAILNGIEYANEAVALLGVGAGTTLSIIEMQDNVIRPYHIGDSMIMLIGQRGKVKLQTISHSPMGYAVESGLMDENEAMQHEERHLVSNVIGANDMRIEVGPSLELDKRDTLIIASDGLSDNLSSEEIIELVRIGPLKRNAQNLQIACHEKMQTSAAGESGKPDDLSFIIFRQNLEPASSGSTNPEQTTEP